MGDAEAEEEAYYEEKMVKEYEAEIERLRAALREIAEDDIDWWVTKTAKEALGNAYINHAEKGKAEGLNKALGDAVEEELGEQ